MSTAQLIYSKEDVEKIIRQFLESKNVTVNSVKIEVRMEHPDRQPSPYPVFDKAVVEIDPGNVVAQ